MLKRYVRAYHLAPRYATATSLSLKTEDGVRLAAVRLEAEREPVANIVLVHGFSNWSRSPRVHEFAHWLARRAHVVVPDLRGHGRSGGLTTFGRDEPLDIDAAARAALDHGGHALPLVTVGMSMGAAAVLIHAAAAAPAVPVAGVFAISAPAFFAVGSAGTKRMHRWIRGPAGRIALATALRTRVAPLGASRPRAADAVSEIAPAFVVLVHDPTDWYFDEEHARALYEAASEPKELWWYPGGGHGTDLLTEDLAARVLQRIERGGER